MKHPDHADVQRWTTQDRYYTLRVQQDLFGQWELLKVWGSLHSRHGRHQVCPAASLEAAASLLTSEARRRARRGYRASQKNEGSNAAGGDSLSGNRPASH